MFDPGWETFHEQARGRWPDLSFVRFAMKTYGNAPDRSALRFLELGCGSGAQVAFLAEEGFPVVAVDGSHSALKTLRDLLRRRDLALMEVIPEGWRYVVQPVEADIATFDAPPGWYDCILDICTLQHLPDADAAAIIAKARGWLKPGGWFFSVMLDFAEGYTFPAPVYPRDEKGVAALFDGYDVKVGYQYEDRPDDAKIAHWIIEAQVTT